MLDVSYVVTPANSDIATGGKWGQGEGSVLAGKVLCIHTPFILASFLKLTSGSSVLLRITWKLRMIFKNI